MYTKILVPVDLEHLDRLEKALTVAIALGKEYGAEICYVGVTTALPSKVAHTPGEYTQKLEGFAQQQAAASGLTAGAKVFVSHDPTIDLIETLLRAIDELGSDLVVMASHIPGVAEHICASHGGALASHAKVSVFLVR